MASLPVPIPPTEFEQHKIADCLSALDFRIGAQVVKLDNLRIHKQGLLQQLFPPLESYER